MIIFLALNPASATILIKLSSEGVLDEGIVVRILFPDSVKNLIEKKKSDRSRFLQFSGIKRIISCNGTLNLKLNRTN